VHYISQVNMSIADSSRGERPTPKSTQEHYYLVGELHKNIKYNYSKAFSGKRTKLKGFLTQLKLYMAFYNK